MLPDWPTLFNQRPLVGRAVRLCLPGLVEPVWFAFAGTEDLRSLPAETFLAPAEQARSSEFKFGPPRESFTLGRMAGKLAVAGPLTLNRYSDEEAEGELARRLRAFEIGNGDRGEPVVRVGDLQTPPALATGATHGGWKPPAPSVSLSHVNGRGVAVAFGVGQRVGLDLELIDAKRAETVRQGVPLSAEEETWLKATSLPAATALLLLWTAREALGKALGCGLACQWETLALRHIASAGVGVCSGQFLRQPQFGCLSWIGSDAVMSVVFAPT